MEVAISKKEGAYLNNKAQNRALVPWADDFVLARKGVVLSRACWMRRA